MAKLFLIFQISDTAAMDVQKALASNVQDYEDAVMIETAVREGFDCIVTRNIHDYSKSTIPVYSPDEFFKHYSFRMMRNK